MSRPEPGSARVPWPRDTPRPLPTRIRVGNINGITFFKISDMTTTVKLPPELEQALRQHCAAAGRNISEVMREALVAYLSRASTDRASAWSLGADLFGRYRGPADLAARRHSHLEQVWEAKHADRTRQAARTR